jgi:hypothetical protein
MIQHSPVPVLNGIISVGDATYTVSLVLALFCNTSAIDTDYFIDSSFS